MSDFTERARAEAEWALAGSRRSVARNMAVEGFVQGALWARRVLLAEIRAERRGLE